MKDKIKYNKENPLRVFEAFAGYGAPSLALKRLKQNYPDFHYTIVGMSEIEPNAIKAYKALHGDVKNYGSITDILWDDVPDFDLFFYGFPCTDLSSAGQQKGMEKGNGTRSSLLWECERAIENKRPAICIMENVVALVSQKFIKQFNEWQNVLDRLGYANFTQVLDSSMYGIPQHRERVFMVSILRTEDNPEPKYYFPKPFPLTKRLKNVLEQNVDEKYYLSDERIQGLINSTEKERERGNGFKFEPTNGVGISHTVKTTNGSRKTDTFLYEDIPDGIDGCKSDSLKLCAKCKFDNATTECSRIHYIGRKDGVNVLKSGNPYV